MASRKEKYKKRSKLSCLLEKIRKTMREFTRKVEVPDKNSNMSNNEYLGNFLIYFLF